MSVGWCPNAFLSLRSFSTPFCWLLLALTIYPMRNRLIVRRATRAVKSYRRGTRRKRKRTSRPTTPVYSLVVSRKMEECSRFRSSISTRDARLAVSATAAPPPLLLIVGTTAKYKKKDGHTERGFALDDDEATPKLLVWNATVCLQSTPLFQLCKTNSTKRLFWPGVKCWTARPVMVSVAVAPQRMMEFRIGFLILPDCYHHTPISTSPSSLALPLSIIDQLLPVFLFLSHQL